MITDYQCLSCGEYSAAGKCASCASEEQTESRLETLADEIKQAQAKHLELPSDYSEGYLHGLAMALDIMEGRLD